MVVPDASFYWSVNHAQPTLFFDRIEYCIDEDNSVRAIEAFVDALKLQKPGFQGMVLKSTGSITSILE